MFELLYISICVYSEWFVSSNLFFWECHLCPTCQSEGCAVMYSLTIFITICFKCWMRQKLFFTVCLCRMSPYRDWLSPHISCLAFVSISAFLIFLRFLVTNVSHQNTKLIRHPIFVNGLFVTIISISKQCRQTVSVSGRTRPFLSSYVHIQKQQWRKKIEASIVLQMCDRAEINWACCTNTVLEQFVHWR